MTLHGGEGSNEQPRNLHGANTGWRNQGIGGEDHISLITRVDTVLQDLLERAGLSM
jgi:hypothetical protein